VASKHILIVEGRFYPSIADEMKAGAITALEAAGYSYEVIDVPGALEIPATIGFAANSKKFAGYIALGCVIRGETSHYHHVCHEAIHGLQKLALRERLAIGTGILTVEDQDQAHARGDQDKGNKGALAAAACLRMIAIRSQLLDPS